ncbi:MAG: hypothetical protein V2A54_08285 [Bacteroidota bacterium]
MKKLFLVVGLLFAVAHLSAQKVKVESEKKDIAGAKRDAFTVVIPEADQSTIEKSWRSLMKKYNGDVSTKDGVFADNAKISEISENTTDVYARTEKLENGVKLIVVFDLGGAFLTSSMHPAQYKVAEKIIREFSIKAATEAVDDKLKEQEKKFREADENLKDLVKENEKLKSNIESYKKKIEEAEADLKKNGEDQVKAKSAVEAQQKVVDQWKDKKKSIE